MREQSLSDLQLFQTL
uniref:Uncharacterized protein n=1 Tax=Anguilla anguilla TaxID=7936 RepID=A0A0E9T7E8_ANGAN